MPTRPASPADAALSIASLGGIPGRSLTAGPIRCPAKHGRPWTRSFVSINEQNIESQQLTRIATLADNAYKSADAISQALEAAGLPVDSDFGKSDVGGPLIPLDSSMIFDSKVKELDEALDALDHLKTEARRLPLTNPAPAIPSLARSGFAPTRSWAPRPCIQAWISGRRSACPPRSRRPASSSRPAGTAATAGWSRLTTAMAFRRAMGI